MTTNMRSQTSIVSFRRSMDYREVYAGLRTIVGDIASNSTSNNFDEFKDDNCNRCHQDGVELTLWLDEAQVRFHFFTNSARDCLHIPRPLCAAARQLRSHSQLFIRAVYDHSDDRTVQYALDIVTNRAMVWFETLAASTAA